MTHQVTLIPSPLTLSVVLLPITVPLMKNCGKKSHTNYRARFAFLNVHLHIMNTTKTIREIRTVGELVDYYEEKSGFGGSWATILDKFVKVTALYAYSHQGAVATITVGHSHWLYNYRWAKLVPQITPISVEVEAGTIDFQVIAFDWEQLKRRVCQDALLEYLQQKASKRLA